jgi:N4-gp56 family major capsid protein
MSYEMYWSTQSSYLTNNTLNKSFQKVAQPMYKFRQFCAIKEAFGKGKGESVNWLKVDNASAYGGTVAETSTIPETTLPLSWGTVTVGEYGLAIPFTGKIEALSEFDINQLVKGALLDDNVKVIDGVVEREFNKTPNVYCGTSTSTGTFYTASSCTETNTSVLNTYQINQMAAYLRDKNVPGFPGLNGDYVFICAGNQMQELKNAMTGIYQYTELGLKYIANGEIGRLNGVRFVEDGFATKYVFSASARTATAITWTKSQSGPGYMFGSPTVREAVAVPEEIRVKIPTDYGRSKGIAWYGLFGWGLEWSTTANARIVKWESKA